VVYLFHTKYRISEEYVMEKKVPRDRKIGRKTRIITEKDTTKNGSAGDAAEQMAITWERLPDGNSWAVMSPPEISYRAFLSRDRKEERQKTIAEKAIRQAEISARVHNYSGRRH
jgi:hypothetical protein